VLNSRSKPTASRVILLSGAPCGTLWYFTAGVGTGMATLGRRKPGVIVVSAAWAHAALKQPQPIAVPLTAAVAPVLMKFRRFIKHLPMIREKSESRPKRGTSNEHAGVEVKLSRLYSSDGARVSEGLHYLGAALGLTKLTFQPRRTDLKGPLRSRRRDPRSFRSTRWPSPRRCRSSCRREHSSQRGAQGFPATPPPLPSPYSQKATVAEQASSA
jgi:hypothetical protein